MTDAVTAADRYSAFQRWMILGSVVLSQTLYGMSLLTVTVVLPQMQGSLAATQDQISWVVTLNILATAVMTPMAGWLTARFGRRKVMLYCATGFSIATVLCGMAQSLWALVIYRVLQGGFGAPMTPLGNAIVLDVFPKHQHGMATSVYGMGVVIGPILGPIVGGALAEAYDWRWVFWLLVPFSVIAIYGLWSFLTDAGRERDVRFDWTGFLALSIAVSCLQLILDRGQGEDWFASIEIQMEAAIGFVAFWVFVVHSLTARRPFLNPRHLLDRNYTLGLLIVFIYGMLNFTPMVLLPTMLKDLMDFPESIIGFLIACRGIGAMGGFFLAMWVGRLDPRIGLTAGFLLQAASGVLMMRFDLTVTRLDVAITSLMQGVSVGLIWVPLVVATFATLDRRFLAESTAVFHLLRNLGSSIFISASVTVLIRVGQVAHARLTEFISPYSDRLEHTLWPWFWSPETLSGLAAMEHEISRQAAMIGYLNAFGLFTVAGLAALPLIFMVRIPKRAEN